MEMGAVGARRGRGLARAAGDGRADQACVGLHSGGPCTRRAGWTPAGVARGFAVVAEQPALSFAGLLRQLRAEALLTQEELAEAAGVSPRSVSDLERGINRTARKDTALLLADALRLTGQVRALFVAAARGRAPAADVIATGNGAAAQGAGAVAATRTLP